MARSANRSTHPVNGIKTETQVLTARLTGGGAGVSAVVAETNAGDIVSATIGATGKYAIVFRYVYPQLLASPILSFVGTTDGLVGQCSAIDITAGTAALEIYVGSTPTDLATTDTVYLTWVVRNSSKNPATV